MVELGMSKRCDIVLVSLNPTVGRKQHGNLRPALLPGSPKGVSSPALLGSSCHGLGRGKVGVPRVNMVCTLDLDGCRARKLERASVEVVNDALARLQAIAE